ncbi:MAG: zinc ABC transporter substrate-binding protein [Bacilli bacterium]|nr:zinc ABC transporter substrate-binding protein [Bacilli bacterium]
MKKLISVLIIIVSIFIISGCSLSDNNKKTIIATNFPAYDFAREITKGSDIEVKMLLKPGSESHDYEPSPKDIISISKASMFIYVGGESDEWVDDLLDSIDTSNIQIVKMIDEVNAVYEEKVDGMTIEEDEDEEEYDEHVWTSPRNVIAISRAITDKVHKIDAENWSLYEDNFSSYRIKLEELDQNFKDVVNNSNRKELIFADRFPFRYFVDEYGLSYYAAFPGCSSETEASAKTISFLINKVKEDNIPVILTIEFSNKKIAKTISKETGTKVLELNSAHNISKEDFENGKTYLDIMNDNLEVLKEALK